MSTQQQLVHDIVSSEPAKPFIKWVGGKGQLLSQFLSLYPACFNNYFEPFLGGGAVFFALHGQGRLNHDSFLSDTNSDLILTYEVVRDSLPALIMELEIHQSLHDKEYYYQIRDLDRTNLPLTRVQRAARFIYLNKTGFNGLYRVNRRNQFNVPMGSYTNPRIFSEVDLRQASLALGNATLTVGAFDEIIDNAKAGDFVYFDPPYDPVSKTANFTGYTAGNFGDNDQTRLAEVYKALTQKGCYCMLSNSFTPFIIKLYSDYFIQKVSARRAVNSNGDARGAVVEIVVLNYR